MDTPGHVSEGDGQEEDENKWGVGGGEGKNGCRVNYTNAKRENAEKEEWSLSERNNMFLRKRLCQGLESHGTFCTALHVTHEITHKPAFLVHCSSKAKCFEHLNPLLSLL